MYKRLKGLKVEDYEYPGEKGAFQMVKKIPFLDKVVGEYQNLQLKITGMPEIIGDCYRVTEETFPSVYSVHKKAMDRLDMGMDIPLYIKMAYEYNAYTMGVSEPVIVIHSSMINDLTESELLSVLGHEMGHIKSGHLLYYNMATGFMLLINKIPYLGSQAVMGLYYALMSWRRMQECTADRAGALASGDVEGGMRVLGRLLGTAEEIPFLNMKMEHLLQQYESFEIANDDLLTKVVCVYQNMNQTHPWTIQRIKELQNWRDSGGFEEVIGMYG